MRTNVYVDGFNLYHGCLQFSLYEWLNLRKLSENMLSGHQVNKIKFFTAKISAWSDPDQPARQMIYWRALRTIENLEIIEGTFYEPEKRWHYLKSAGTFAAVQDGWCESSNSKKGSESAGINRHIVGDERALRKRRSDSILASSLACDLARVIAKRRQRNWRAGHRAAKTNNPSADPFLTAGRQHWRTALLRERPLGSA